MHKLEDRRSMLLQAALGQPFVQALPELDCPQPPLCCHPPAGVNASAQRIAHVLLAHSFKRQSCAAGLSIQTCMPDTAMHTCWPSVAEEMVHACMGCTVGQGSTLPYTRVNTSMTFSCMAGSPE